ncbi:mitochondrial outer membrane lipid metabolism regulator Opa3 [Schizosaccharomyces osmophilus]|uniref:Mitochondrial outer membrane lipid metabolism regulator Opa3 n=1 Tax=Schizosaccharomyces osmophilus TaxID=2545709 RepID=A0AAF0AVC8_9SCHI|nr:mitochondrial outer membrane lipid metabolism regulator Opa3 [Schizosaccharomyces osmophilus]WBW72407.1 mitochondrial outer membrane lipid metabolism regulator Opa3 [Schizosaccharomyces osmophilus]
MSSLALKIGSLLVRTLSKPIANTIKAQAKEHKTFRKVCIDFAQIMHRAEFKIMGANRARSGHTNVRVRPLNDAKAVDAGANFLSETFVFTVAGGAILFETWRVRRKEKNRRDNVAEAIVGLQQEIIRIHGILEKQVLEKKVKGAEVKGDNDHTYEDFEELHKVMHAMEQELHTLSSEENEEPKKTKNNDSNQASSSLPPSPNEYTSRNSSVHEPAQLPTNSSLSSQPAKSTSPSNP